MQSEMAKERDLKLQRKLDEREYFSRIRKEHEVQRTQREKQLRKEKEEDKQIQKTYCQLIDQQEDQRQQELDLRQQKARLFLNQQEGQVVTDRRHMLVKEDQKVKNYLLQQQVAV